MWFNEGARLLSYVARSLKLLSGNPLDSHAEIDTYYQYF